MASSSSDFPIAPDRPLWPVLVNLTPDITITIFHHTIPAGAGDTVQCWTYISNGLRASGQRELVVTLRRRPTESVEAWSREPLDWFKILESWGRQRRIVDSWHTHLLESAHWLGSKNLCVVSHGMPICLPNLPQGVVLPRIRVHGLAFTQAEADVGKAFGWLRAESHLGLSCRWFPYPPWIDRDRGQTVSLEMMEGSFRGRELDPKRIRGVTVRWKGQFLILEIPPGREAELKALVEGSEVENVLSLDSCLHPEADFGTMWQAGQERRLQGYSSNNSPTVKNFGFIAFCPSQANDSWTCNEDGCTLLITDETWRTIRTAMVSKENLQVRISDDLVFSLVFSTMGFYDYFSSGENEPNTQAVSNGPPGTGTHIVLQQMVLGNQDAFAGAEATILVDFVRRILAVLQGLIPADRGSLQPLLVLVQYNQSLDGASPWTIFTDKDPTGLNMQAITDAVSRVPLPSGWEGRPLSFVAVYGVWGAKAPEGMIQLG